MSNHFGPPSQGGGKFQVTNDSVVEFQSKKQTKIKSCLIRFKN